MTLPCDFTLSQSKLIAWTKPLPSYFFTVLLFTIVPLHPTNCRSLLAEGHCLFWTNKTWLLAGILIGSSHLLCHPFPGWSWYVLILTEQCCPFIEQILRFAENVFGIGQKLVTGSDLMLNPPKVEEKSPNLTYPHWMSTMILSYPLNRLRRHLKSNLFYAPKWLWFQIDQLWKNTAIL